MPREYWCMHDTWACWRLCDGLFPLVSVAIPLVIPGQAVANCCNTGVCCAPGDIRHPKCSQSATYREIWLATAVLLHRAVSESRTQHGLGVGVRCRSGTRNWVMGLPSFQHANCTQFLIFRHVHFRRHFLSLNLTNELFSSVVNRRVWEATVCNLEWQKMHEKCAKFDYLYYTRSIPTPGFKTALKFQVHWEVKGSS